jgi:hypothetical protein
MDSDASFVLGLIAGLFWFICMVLIVSRLGDIMQTNRRIMDVLGNIDARVYNIEVGLNRGSQGGSETAEMREGESNP